MPTSDERREVAAKLRERERGWRKMATHVNVMQDRPATQFEDIAALLGFNGWILDADIFARLADLIDPTCHVVSEALHTGSFGCEEAGTEFTLSCGHTVIVDGDFPPGYCDECGARVVSGDDC